MLIPNWRRVLMRAWSVWLVALIGAAQLLPEILAAIEPAIVLPRELMARATAAAAVATIIARLMVQPDVE